MINPQFDVQVQAIDPERALALRVQAPSSTVFTHPQVLAALSFRVQWWLAEHAGVAICIWPICVDSGGRTNLPGLSYYVGPLWLLAPEPSARRRLLLEVAVFQSMLSELRKHYGSFRFSLSPSIHDLRAFLWFQANGSAVSAKPRYTACISGLQRLSEAELLALFSYERRADARRTAARGVCLLQNCSFEQIDSLYARLMDERGVTGIYMQRRAELLALWDLVKRGFGYVVACGNSSDDQLRAVWLVLCENDRACGVIAAAEPAWRAQQNNAWVCWQALIAAKRRGADVYDFNGANSLARGSDKHSYGAEAALYFDLELSDQ